MIKSKRRSNYVAGIICTQNAYVTGHLKITEAIFINYFINMTLMNYFFKYITHTKSTCDKWQSSNTPHLRKQASNLYTICPNMCLLTQNFVNQPLIRVWANTFILRKQMSKSRLYVKNNNIFQIKAPVAY